MQEDYLSGGVKSSLGDKGSGVWAAPLGLALTIDYREAPLRLLLLGYSKTSSGGEGVFSSSFVYFPVPSVKEEGSTSSPAPFPSSVGCALVITAPARSSVVVPVWDRKHGHQGAL